MVIECSLDAARIPLLDRGLDRGVFMIAARRSTSKTVSKVPRRIVVSVRPR